MIRGEASRVDEGRMPVSLTKEDMRNLYRALMDEAVGLVEPSSARDKIRDAVQRAFEMARHSVLIDGRVIEDGVEFRQYCEDKAGPEPVNQELLAKLNQLRAEVEAETEALISIRRSLPLVFSKRVDYQYKNDKGELEQQIEAVCSETPKDEKPRPKLDPEVANALVRTLPELDNIDETVTRARKRLKAVRDCCR